MWLCRLEQSKEGHNTVEHFSIETVNWVECGGSDCSVVQCFMVEWSEVVQNRLTYTGVERVGQKSSGGFTTRYDKRQHKMECAKTF